MAYPTIEKTWTITPNNVIAFASLNQVMGTFLKGMADFLLANGYTCKGSCDGVTGAMDGANRWAAVANASVRAANTTTAVSWMVLTDASGCDILLSYVGATDDVARLSYSPTGVYVAAGTPSHTPTATDEALLASATSLILATASLDRIWNGWVDSESKMCRFQINRNGAMVGVAWGVEVVNPRTTQTFTRPVWGFCYLAAQFLNSAAGSGFFTGYTASSRGGITRILGSNVNVGGGLLMYLLNNSVWGDVQVENLGGVGYPMFGPLAVGSNTASFQGALAYLYDWWTGRNTVTNGDTYDNKNYVQWGGNTGLVWPWDGTTTPDTDGAPGTQNGNWITNMPDYSYGTPLNGFGTYVPLAFSSVEPTGPETLQSIARRAGVQVVRLAELSADPAPDARYVQLYWRLIDGQQAVFAMYPDGTVYQVGAG